MKKMIDEKINKIIKSGHCLMLAFESSCDETSVAIVKDGREILSNIISSQIDIHKRFGGVVPEIASRNHTLAITNVLDQALLTANVTLDDIDAICVTYGAGLVGALMIGVNFAKALAYSLNLPLIAVNHIKGHIAGNYIAHKNLEPPFMCLVVSGGHTAIIKVDDYINHTYIGGTIDDAVGECYDKVARVLGLSYPGGPKIDKAAKQGIANIEFTKRNQLKDSYDFSYSGLKTAVISYIHNLKQKGKPVIVENVCASFQEQAVKGLVDKTIKAAKVYNMDKIVLAGGVSANSYLREQMTLHANKENISVYFPPLSLCTDNAAMIGSAGYYNLMNKVGIADLTLSPSASVSLKNK